MKENTRTKKQMKQEKQKETDRDVSQIAKAGLSLRWRIEVHSQSIFCLITLTVSEIPVSGTRHSCPVSWMTVETLRPQATPSDSLMHPSTFGVRLQKKKEGEGSRFSDRQITKQTTENKTQCGDRKEGKNCSVTSCLPARIQRETCDLIGERRVNREQRDKREKRRLRLRKRLPVQSGKQRSKELQERGLEASCGSVGIGCCV